MKSEPEPRAFAAQIIRSLQRRPGRIVVEGPRTSLSAAEILLASDRLAKELTVLGIGPGDAVVVALANAPAFLPTCVALMRISTTVVLLAEKSGADEFAAVLDATRARACLTSGRAARRLGRERHPVAWRDLEVAGDPVRAFLSEGPSTPDRVRAACLVKYTSGSSGRPKGVLLGEDNLQAELASVVEALGLGPEDRILASVPLTHSYGFDLGALPVLFGYGTLVLGDRFVPRRTMRQLARGAGSVLLGVPAMYRFLLELPDPEPVSPRLRHLLSCTAPLAPELVRQFHARFGRVPCQHYGSSETGAVSLHDADVVLDRIESVGHPMPGVRVEIQDPDGRPLPVGGEGEIVVRGPAVAAGYVHGLESGSDPFVGGGFRTGDLGRVDERGYLYVHGRRDGVINVGGLKVFPQEVVRVLEDHAAVREAAVIGARDAHGETCVVAMVALRTPAREEDLLAHCRGRLALHKLPRRIDVCDALPRTAAGKVRLTPEDLEVGLR